MNNFNIFLIIGVAFYFATVTSGCPNCIPARDIACPDTPICSRVVKRSIACPPCIPLTVAVLYQTKCPSTPFCIREKRSTNDCPPCIPSHLVQHYTKHNLCIGTPVCTKIKTQGKMKRSPDACPPCIPFHMINFYETHKPECASQPICFKKRATKDKVKRSPIECPLCIPFHMKDFYKDLCPNTSICVKSKVGPNV